jgi:polar amino acid transport system substrate-binding protein
MNLLRFLLSLFSLVLLASCASTPSVAPNPSVLRVGVSPDFPPLIYKQGGQIVGVEADFASALGEKLGRSITFVELEFEKQLDALEENRIDIVMSGMSMTRARSFRASFTYPYMTAGLTPMFRRSDYAPSGLIPSLVRHQTSTVGCVEGTTGAIYAKNAYVHAKVMEYPTWDRAVQALKDGKVNMVVYDAPAVWWAVSRDEDTLAAFPELLNREEMAWAISKSTPGLLEEVNAALEQLRASGEGVAILKRWFPNM